MSGQEYGIFFCAHCGTTPYVEVSAQERPTADCPTCGSRRMGVLLQRDVAVYPIDGGVLSEKKGAKMTDQEKQSLSERIATLAEAAGIDGALLWSRDTAHCPDGHVGRAHWSACLHEIPRPGLTMACAKPLQADALDMTDPAVLLAVVEAWQEVQRMLIVRMDFGRTDQWRGYLHICIPLPEGRESLAEDHDYPGYGQSWGEAAAQALRAALEAEKGDHHDD